jgi:tape measure domain-containing protein
MAEEKRSLIYELLVEAKGADKVKDELAGVSKGLSQLSGVAKGALGILAAGFALKGIAAAVDELTKFRLAMETLGLSAQETSATLASVQSTAFATGKSIQEVGKVYGEAIQLNQALSRSSADAARSASAFVKIANAEGRSVASAAAQINTLTFAIESGTLNGKAFNTMLKDSPTFARAAQEALGLTTQQLVALAKEGKLSSEQLTEIILKVEELGEQTGTVVTLDGIVQGLKTLTTSFIQATAEAAGFSAKLGPGALSTLQDFLDFFVGLGKVIGGTTRFVSNFIQEMISVARLFAQLAADPFDWKATFGRYSEDLGQDLADMEESIYSINAGLKQATGNNPERDPATVAQRKAEQDRRDEAAKQAARDRDRVKAFGDSFDAAIKRQEEQRKELARQAERDAKEAEREAKRLAKERADASADVYANMQKERVAHFKKGEKEIEDYLETQSKKGIEEFLNEKIPDITDLVLDQFKEIEAATAVVENAFADLFSGGIHNAREFFAVVTQGLANIFAQIAAQQATEGLTDFLNDILGGISWGKSGKSAAELIQIGPPRPSAMGNAFMRGHVIPFASGGVVSGPTTFGMAGGATGVMGEAGPEAVMPLRRTSGGKLGVSGSMPNITVVNNLGVPAAARMKQSNERMTLILEAAQMGANLAEGRINRSLRSGYGSTAQSVQGTYGLRRRT